MTTTYKRFRVRMYVGPVAVSHYAERAKGLGYTDIVEGTEHIYFTTGWLAIDREHPETDSLCRRQDIGQGIYGQPMTAVWRDVEIMRAL